MTLPRKGEKRTKGRWRNKQVFPGQQAEG